MTLCSPIDLNSRKAILNDELERIDIDIAALSETRLSGSGNLRERSYTIYWSGKPEGDPRMHGVGFAVKNSILPFMETPLGISPRIMLTKFHGKNGSINIISVYAPTLQATEEDKDCFYSQLEMEIKKVPEMEALIVLGDFNAGVGAKYELWPNVLGKQGIGKVNENGQRLLEVCAIHSLCVTNTYFAGKNIRKTSWMHPRSKNLHQLDLILTRRKDIKEILHTRSYHSADCNTDHSLVCTKVKFQLKKRHHTEKQPCKKINTTAASVGNQKTS